MRPPLSSLLLLLCGCAVPGGRYTPLGRPLSDSAETVRAGTTEVELGYLDGEGGDHALQAGAHWGASATTELFFDALPQRRLGGPPRSAGASDVQIGLVHRFFEETALIPAGAFGVRIKVPTGDEDKGLSTGEFDALSTIIASQHFGRVLGRFVYEFAVLGEPSGVKLVHRVIVDAGIGLGPGVGLLLEAVGSADVEADEENLDLLAGIELEVSDRTTLDLFGSLPAADEGGEWTIGIGATIRFGN